MMFISEYGLPLLAALLLVIFFSYLPDLRSCSLPEFAIKGYKRGFAAKLPILLLTLVYALVAFYKLGNAESPESFHPMQGKTVVLELNEPAEAANLMLFPGVGMGNYDIVYNFEDGSSSVENFVQGHVQVLCWQKLPISAQSAVRSVEIRCTSGSPWMGEIAVCDANGNIYPAGCSVPQLCDEQDTVPFKSNYMNSSYFDEIYHARTAWEHLESIWPYEISHPPLAKIILSIGIELFGMTPFGWRFMGTLFGVLMLPLMYEFLRRMFGGLWVPALGSILLATDFMHFSQTRIATIDSYAVFFILLMYYFMYRYITEDSKFPLALCGISFGLGAASKWTCLYAGLGLSVLWLLYWIKALKSGSKDAKAFSKNIVFCVVFFVLIPALIYYLSYIPYGNAQNCRPFSYEYTKIVLDNQKFMLSYHSAVNAEHPYSSRWYQWILNIRPILYYLEYFVDGSRSSIAAFLNPALCWGGFLFLFVLLYTAIFRRCKTAAFILISYLAQVLPWVFISRTTFEYHYFAGSVFLVLTISYVFDILRKNIKSWRRLCIGFAAVSTVLFVMFYPALSGARVDNKLASAIMGWLPSWPL